MMSILDGKWRGQEKHLATTFAERCAHGTFAGKSPERHTLQATLISERQWWVVTDEYGALPLAALLREVADRTFTYPEIERSRAA